MSAAVLACPVTGLAGAVPFGPAALISLAAGCFPAPPPAAVAAGSSSLPALPGVEEGSFNADIPLLRPALTPDTNPFPLEGVPLVAALPPASLGSTRPS